MEGALWRNQGQVSGEISNEYVIDTSHAYNNDSDLNFNRQGQRPEEPLPRGLCAAHQRLQQYNAGRREKDLSREGPPGRGQSIGQNVS